MAGTKQQSLTVWLNNEGIKAKFIDKLGKQNAEATMSAMLSLYNSNRQLQECDPKSIMGAAMLAVTSGLSISPALSQAYIVPFHGVATFQVGVKGLVQLAHRTRQYVALHAGKICEGEFKGINPFTGEPERGEKISDKVVGYVAYMRLVNGFEKTFYMTLEEIEAHALKYSKSYAYDVQYGKKASPWTTNFEAMARKTVLKRLLNTWGILSTEMVNVIQGDQAVIDKNAFTYVDNGGDSQARDTLFIPEEMPQMQYDSETGEVIEVNQEAQSDESSN